VIAFGRCAAAPPIPGLDETLQEEGSPTGRSWTSSGEPNDTAGFTAWRVKWIERKTLALVAYTYPPISSELHDVSAALAYTMGLHAGLSATQGAFFSAAFLAGGIRLRFGGRKGRLLIRLFDLAANAQDPPDPRTQA
jgi:hypothetical protein